MICVRIDSDISNDQRIYNMYQKIPPTEKLNDKKILFYACSLAVFILQIILFTGCNQSSSTQTDSIQQIAGAKIVFASDITGNKQLYTMKIDGSNITRLTHNNYEDSSPKWSPNGTKIVFTRFNGFVYKTFIINKDGSDEMPLTAGNSNELNPAWFPGGDRIIFQKIKPGLNAGLDSRLYSVKTDGSEEIAINTGLTFTHYLSDDIEGETYPSVSPSGTRVLFSYYTRPYRYGSGDIYSCNLDGTNLKNLTNLNMDPSNIFFKACWSPDGSKIVYSKNHFPASNIKAIYTMDPDGSNQAELASSNYYNNDNPGWAPGGNLIVFDTDRDGTKQIYIMDSSGQQVKRISNNSFNNTEPDVILE